MDGKTLADSMNAMDLEQLLSSSKTLLTDIMNNVGNCPSMFVCVTKDNVYFLKAPWEDEAQKARMLMLYQIQFTIWDITKYVLLSEIWRVERSVEEQKTDKRLPSECEDRVEGVHSVVVDKTGAILYTADIVRNDDGSFKELINPKELRSDGENKLEGRMTKLMPLEAHEHRLDEAPPVLKQMLNMYVSANLIPMELILGPR